MTHASEGSLENPISRRAARVLLINGAGQVLMFRGADPASPQRQYWFTVGGGVDAGETVEQAALRELREETGLALSQESLEGPLWHDLADFPFDGRWYRQEQDFFAVRVESWEVSVDGFDREESRSITAFRWWSLDELSQTREAFYPVELPQLLGQLLGV